MNKIFNTQDPLLSLFLLTVNSLWTLYTLYVHCIANCRLNLVKKISVGFPHLSKFFPQNVHGPDTKQVRNGSKLEVEFMTRNTSTALHQQCPFGKNRGSGLVYHLSSLPVANGLNKPLYSSTNQCEYNIDATVIPHLFSGPRSPSSSLCPPWFMSFTE